MTKSIRNYQSNKTKHAHDDFHQIIVPIKGDLELEVDSKQGIVTGRTIGIVLLGEKHTFSAPKENSFIVLDINKEDLGEQWDMIWNQATKTPFITMSQALLCLSEYASYCIERESGNHLLEVWQNLFLQTLLSDLDNDLNNLPDRLKKVMNHIEHNFGHQLSNADMADISCLSPSHFHQVFQKNIGISPQQYLTKKRLNAAKKLILNGCSLAHVADEVGFADQSTFGRAFKKSFDISPSRWREKTFSTKNNSASTE